MQIQPARLIPLGYGRFARSDDIIAIEPVTEGRGPQRRALVWVRGLPTPLVASRSEQAIASDLVTPDQRTEAQRRAQFQRVRSMLREANEVLAEDGAAAA